MEDLKTKVRKILDTTIFRHFSHLASNAHKRRNDHKQVEKEVYCKEL